MSIINIINKIKYKATPINLTGKFSFDDISGYDMQKRELKLILLNLEKWKKETPNFGILEETPLKGVLFTGYPGLGKTLFAKVLIAEAKLPTYIIDGTVLEGDASSACVAICKTFKEASKNEKAIIFIDEVHRIVSSGMYSSDLSRSVLSTLLTQLDGIESHNNVFVIMTANDESSLDSALIRAGRVDKIINFGSPNYKDRRAIISRYVKDNWFFNSPIVSTISEEMLESLTAKTEGFSCATLKSLVNETAIYLQLKINEEQLSSLSSNDIITAFLDRIYYLDTSQSFANDEGIAYSKEYYENSIYHELGHLITHFVLFDKRGDVYITPAQQSSENQYGGLMCENDSIEDDSLRDKTDVLKKVLVFIAGGIAGNYFTKQEGSRGASSDITNITFLLHDSLAEGVFGLDKIGTYVDSGLLSYTPQEEPYIGLYIRQIVQAAADIVNLICKIYSSLLTSCFRPLFLHTNIVTAETFKQNYETYKNSHTFDAKDLDELQEKLSLYYSIKLPPLSKYVCSKEFEDQNLLTQADTQNDISSVTIDLTPKNTTPNYFSATCPHCHASDYQILSCTSLPDNHSIQVKAFCLKCKEEFTFTIQR